MPGSIRQRGLGPSTALDLDCAGLRELGEAWSDGGLWEDILWLSLLVWSATDGKDRLSSWHHLVMAVGNFKRQGGRRLQPARLSPVEHLRFDPTSAEYEVPGSGHVLHRDEPDSWVLKLKGAATATTTTLLAALWPESHHILDWRVLAASSALALGTPDDLGFVQPDGRQHVDADLAAHYPSVRRLLRRIAADADLPLTVVERGLYSLTQQVKEAQDRTWAEYREALLVALSRGPSVQGHAEGPTDYDNDGTPAAP
jgi:hypothetical protein